MICFCINPRQKKMITKQYSKTKPVCKVTFSVPLVQAGEQADLRVLGDFNQWNWEQALKLAAGKDAYQGALELAAGQSYEFRYLVDGQRWLNEEAADGYVATPYFSHNCLLQLDAAVAAPTVKQPKATTSRAKQPAVKAAPAEVMVDDLTRIKGVDSQMAALLVAAGVDTFDALAKAKPAALKAVLVAAGLNVKTYDPASWTKQAKFIVAGA
jgi:predicted flap endonuclease-1-like 5' DNA nuclease